MEDKHFRELFDEYDRTEHQVHRINTGEEVAIDEYAHEVKAKFLSLKDQIYSYLNK
ncbi:YdcH family protein [Flavobacterium sp.]|uniref:YdcH family protein n=1 Tax=Flavobacterium sp. TaxID=239 RepID=UPI0037BE7B6B